VPPVDTQLLFMHCVPIGQTLVQLPQWLFVMVVSTQAPEHSIWPAAEQAQVPLVQAVAPLGHALQPPQCWVVPSPPFWTQVLPHISGVAPVHDVEQVVPLHTWPLGQAFVQLPQWVASEGTQLPLQSRRPLLQTHCPFWQPRIAPQVVPHAPQFWLSVATVLHWPLQFIWPAPQAMPVPPDPVVPPVPGSPPLVGFAQLAASSKQPRKVVRRTERDRVVIDEPRR